MSESTQVALILLAAAVIFSVGAGLWFALREQIREQRARREWHRLRAAEEASDEAAFRAVSERAVHAWSYFARNFTPMDHVTFDVTLDEFRVLDARLRYRDRPNETPMLCGMKLIVRDAA